ncbi:hypothetical protein [Streptomyces sp. NPDC048188]|uniref:hypothetical protein n=1 Tax=Streptomyces sp. NPDC048188 TaxID=3155749 RepID=UPI0034313291
MPHSVAVVSGPGGDAEQPPDLAQAPSRLFAYLADFADLRVRQGLAGLHGVHLVVVST